jgi:hypothetical protein
MPEKPQTNGLLNVSLERWVGVVQSLGIPALFMLFVLFLAYRHVPPLVRAHINTLERTIEALDDMTDTLRKIEQQTERLRVFMDQVSLQHDEQCVELREIRAAMEAN